MTNWNGFAGSIASNNRDTVLNQWIAKKAEFDRVQAEERALRKEVEEIFSEENLSQLLSGTESIELGTGTLKIVRTVDYEFKMPGKNGKNVSIANEKVNEALDKIEKTIGGNGGTLIAQRLVKWKPELSVTEYKQLPEAARKIIDEVLMTKQGSTSVKFEQK